MKIIEFSNPTEELVLAFWACNQSVKQSAKSLNISIRSVNYYRGRLKCRLGARSAGDAIHKIIMMDNLEHYLRLVKDYLYHATEG